MIAVPVTESSQVGDVRRRAATLSQGLGFGEIAAGRVAIAATELATNLVKYASSGEMLIGTFEDESGSGVEIVALDRGPGFANIKQSFRDGYSTGGSPGTGLGAVRRQAQTFDIVSWLGRGSAILARFTGEVAREPTGELAAVQIGAVAVPLQGEVVCGDSYAVRLRKTGWTVLVADGLGHGPMAAQASGEAVRIFSKKGDEAPHEILASVHAGLRHTRGGAVSVARYDADRDVVAFAGIGNVAGAIITGSEIKRTISLAGTAGHVARRIQSFDYPFEPGSALAMYSDGIATSWDLSAYPGLTEAHPTLIAAVIYRDFGRGRDDATVVVARSHLP